MPPLAVVAEGGRLTVTGDFETRQYCNARQLSIGQQIAVCSGRAWKLHLRSKKLFLMCVAGLVLPSCGICGCVCVVCALVCARVC